MTHLPQTQTLTLNKTRPPTPYASHATLTLAALLLTACASAPSGAGLPRGGQPPPDDAPRPESTTGSEETASLKGTSDNPRPDRDAAASATHLDAEDAWTIDVEEGDPLAPLLTTPPNAELVAESVDDAMDDTDRTLACIDYNHITLLNETDKGDLAAVRARLRELRATRVVCEALISRAFTDFDLFLNVYQAEWTFYERYFGLTINAKEVHNRQSFCRRYASTVLASQETFEAARRYAKWLTTRAPADDKTLIKMQRQAKDKVAGFQVVVTRLGSQYNRECTTR